MSDIAETSAHPGTISPRDVDTRTYRVLKPLPKEVEDIAPVGGTFSAWAQGEVFACVSRVGLGRVRNSDIAAWVEAGIVERVANGTESAPGSAVVSAEPKGRHSRHREPSEPLTALSVDPVASGSRPWTLPGAESGKG